MATEQLNSSTVVVDKDIPQTLDERLLQSTTVVDKDIAQTIEEKMLQTTVVAGQVGDVLRTFINKHVATSDNLIVASDLFVDDGGNILVLVQKNIGSGQLMI